MENRAKFLGDGDGGTDFAQGFIQRRVHDHVVHALNVIGIKWRTADQHFKHEDAEGPPVHILAITRRILLVADNYFRGKVLGCSAKRGGRTIR